MANVAKQYVRRIVKGHGSRPLGAHSGQLNSLLYLKCYYVKGASQVARVPHPPYQSESLQRRCSSDPEVSPESLQFLYCIFCGLKTKQEGSVFKKPDFKYYTRGRGSIKRGSERLAYFDRALHRHQRKGQMRDCATKSNLMGCFQRGLADRDMVLPTKLM